MVPWIYAATWRPCSGSIHPTRSIEITRCSFWATAPRGEHEAKQEADNHFFAFGLKLGKLRALHESADDISQEALSSKSIAPGRWAHVAIVRDMHRKRYNLYIDGQLSDSVAYSKNMTGGESPRTLAAIGRSGGAVLNHFDGRIDDVLIYARTVSGPEVLET